MSSITLDLKPPIAGLTLSRDLVGPAEIRDLSSFCEREATDERVRVIVIMGAGDSFSRGWDWSALGEGGALGDPFGCISALSKPVICALRGETSGGGLALALAADIRLAAEGTTFSFPETANGLVPMAGATQRLARLVGRARGLELVLTGRPIDADEALRIGLVSEVVAPAELRRRVEEVALRIAERGPIAVAYAKEAISRGVDMPLEQALRYETELTLLLQATEDRAEGVRAFLEKRKPEFKGK
ncbi:MAG: enoyl-CoA hydratase/isomerase family protein [Dehalococcoidia bacterium]